MFVFLIAGNMMGTVLSGRWIEFCVKLASYDTQLTKQLLYNWCLQDHLIAFTYDVARSADGRHLFICVKLLPYKGKDAWGLLKAAYIKPRKLVNMSTAETTGYQVKKLHLKIFDLNLGVKCVKCGKLTCGRDLDCINYKCQRFRSDTLYSRLFPGEVILTLGFGFDRRDLRPCSKCAACQNCRQKGEKCYRHKVCAHSQPSNHYRMLNTFRTVEQEAATPSTSQREIVEQTKL